MSKILRVFTFILLSTSLSSCLLPNEKGKVSLKLSASDQAARDSSKDSRASVSDVKLINDQIIITGTELDGVLKAKVSQSGSDDTLSILSQSANELILSSSSKIALALNTLMSLTLEDAYGATVVEVTFNLPDSSVSTSKIGDEQVTTAKVADGAITAVKLDQMSAAVGQLLRWDGTTWVASDLDALTYAGTWDASIGGNPNPSAVGGEYYIVSADGVADPGDSNSRSWSQGDWIVYNDNTSSWDQISNSSDVTSFEGRTGGVVAQSGDYTWAMIDKSTSSIGDIADVDLSTPATNGKVLKFDGTNWVAGDDLSGGGAGSVSSSEIADGSIVDADVSASAAIAWSKIDKTGAVASDVGLGNVTNDAQLRAADLDTTATLGTDDTKIPSQAAVKSYVDAHSFSSLTGGAAIADGPILDGGTIDVQVDDTTIEVVSDELQVKALGIGTAQIAASAVTNAKIDSVADTKITTACSDGEVLSASSGNFVCASNSSVGNWTLTADPFLYYTGGNVGIGVVDPDAALEINGQIKITGGAPGANKVLTSDAIGLASWTTLPSAPVTSMFGRTGVVTATTSDYDAAQIDNTPGGTIAATNVQAAINELDSEKQSSTLTDGNIIVGNGSNVATSVVMSGDATITNTGNLQIASGTLVNADISAGAAIAYSKLAVPDGAIAQAKVNGLTALSTSVAGKADESISVIAGSGLSGGGDLSADRTFDLDVDDSTVEVDGTNGLQVKDSGITNAKIDTMADTKLTTACSDGEFLSASSGNFVCSATTSAGNWTLTADPYLYYNGGNVGIGTISPNSLLELKGSLSNSLSGTIDVTLGTAAVSGTGTAFDTELSVGDAIKIEDEVFTVLAIADATHLTLDSNHSTGATGATATSDPTILSLKNGDAKNLLNLDKSGLLSLNGILSLKESSGSDSIAIRSPSSIATSYSLVLPVDDGDNGEVLTTDGSGVLSWAPADAATSVSAGAGSVGTPSMSFSTDSNTGFYSSGADQLGVTSNGVNTFNFTETALSSPTTGGATLTTGNGTASAPTFSFSGDEDTGWFRPAADELAAATAGTERIRIDDSGNVGIGTTAPDGKLHVDGGSIKISDNASSPTQIFNRANGTSSSPSATLLNDTLGQILAGGYGATDSVPGSAAKIRFASAENFTDTTGAAYMTFSTRASGNTGGSLERVRIDEDGNVGIGTTNPTEALDINGELKVSGGVVKHELFSIPVSSTRYLKVNITGSFGYYEINVSGYGSSGSASMMAKWTDGGHGGNSATHQVIDLGRMTQGNPILGELMKTDSGTYLKIENTSSTRTISLHTRIEAFNSSSVIATASLETVEPTGGTSVSFLNILNNGNVGIGTTSPERKLHVERDDLTGYTTFNGSSIQMHDRDNLESDGMASTGSIAGYGSDGRSWFVGDGLSTVNNLRIISDNNSIRLETTGVDNLVVDGTTGNVGIGTTTPSQKLHVVGNLRVQGATDCTLGNGSGATNCTSDERLKDEITPIPDALEKIKSVKGVEFVWNDLARSPGRNDIGVIAQDIQKVFPTAVIENGEGYLSVDYAVLVSPLIESTKELDRNLSMYKLMKDGVDSEQTRRIASLENDNREMRAENQEIKAENQEIKAENQEIKAENQEIKAENQEIKKALCTISPKLSLCDKK